MPAAHLMAARHAGFSLLFGCDAPNGLRQGVGTLQNASFGAADVFITRVILPIADGHRQCAFFEAVFN
jgi:hypothetical protein